MEEGITLARPLQRPRVNYTSHTVPRKTTQVVRPVKFKKPPKKTNPLKGLFLLAFTVILSMFVFPFGYKQFVRPLVFGTAYPSVKVDYNTLYQPTKNYLSNDYFDGVRLLKSVNVDNPQMQSLYESTPMTGLTAKLANLINAYPAIKPSIFVWDFETGKYVDIRGDVPYPAASIIKIPVLMQLFRSIEAGQVNLNDRIPLTEYYRTEGSGSLQFKRAGQYFSVDDLARIMIQESDNSATNMLMSAVGGKIDVNGALKDWGIKNTYIESWLPDIAGTNLTTAQDIATVLYNIDNSSFLSLKSRERIVEYMSHVKNNRLIQAGLPPGAILIHKTGDIGKMVGDAGIVWTGNGKKYIVVMLVKRPHNSPFGKEFIVKASNLIYNSISSGSV